MARIAPLRGLRYNTQKISDLNKVVIPPYDVITADEQELFHRISPYNMVRLELGKPTDQDTAENNPHTRAAEYLKQWQAEGILVRDGNPCIYHYELGYSLDPQTRQSRHGFICALKLEDFSFGTVRPHERTFQNVKDERLRLMLSCHANLSPVFSLYGDPQNQVDSTLMGGREPQPVIDFTDSHGLEHRIWRVEDLETIREAARLMEEKTIFIADGHHRYETGLNYRAIQRERAKTPGPHESYEYIMMYLSNMNDGGLTILPTHRMLRNLNGMRVDAFLEAARAFFEISIFEQGPPGEQAWAQVLQDGGARKENVIGFCCRGGGPLIILKARQEKVSDYLAGKGLAGVLRRLDVVVLDQVILRHLLNLSDDFLADERNIHFKHNLREALSQVRSGDYEAGFFINHTRIEQVEEVASAGLIMPHKSTYFYPKVGSGLAIRLLDRDEKVVC